MPNSTTFTMKHIYTYLYILGLISLDDWVRFFVEKDISGTNYYSKQYFYMSLGSLSIF